MYKGLYHNYFITDDGLVDFIENQKIKENDVYHIDNILKEYCPLEHDESVMQDFYAGAIHLINRKYSIFFHMLKGISVDTGKRSDIFSLYYVRNDNNGQNDTGYTF